MDRILSIIGGCVLLYYALKPPIHVLDFFMYFAVMGVIWGLLELIGQGNFTRELGGLVGMLVIIIATIVYIALFVFCGVDWMDIFQGKYNIDISHWLKW